jgi:glycosyltransferase involved in cell wall biosynthesis
MAVVGVPVHNHADLLPEALESLLGQTRRDVAFVLVDDASHDATPEVVARYAALDDRILAVRNERRLGLVASYRRAFELAREHEPQAPYFAWGSDHDVWHPRWLDELVEAFERNPDAVLAYPHSVRIDEEGRTLRDPRDFSTQGMTDRRERFVHAFRHMSAGNMVYGLFRAEALERAGVYRLVPGPDRLLMTELALQGEFVQVPELLWYRRFAFKVTNARQRAAFFPDRRAPAYMRVPWWVGHPFVLAWQLVVRNSGHPQVTRREGARVAARALVLGIDRAGRRRWRLVRKGIRRQRRRRR